MASQELRNALNYNKDYLLLKEYILIMMHVHGLTFDDHLLIIAIPQGRG